MGTVFFGVANYSWSLSQAESLLMENLQWVYCQYGDPGSNRATLVPGTSVTLQQAQADIDVGRRSWTDLFVPAAPAPQPPPPAPVPPAKRNIYTPLAVDGVFGPLSTKAEQFVSFAGNTADCDGVFGPVSRKSMQAHLGVVADGIIGPVTVKALQARVGAVEDGNWGAQTTMALQRALNAGTY